MLSEDSLGIFSASFSWGEVETEVKLSERITAAEFKSLLQDLLINVSVLALMCVISSSVTVIVCCLLLFL